MILNKNFGQRIREYYKEKFCFIFNLKIKQILKKGSKKKQNALKKAKMASLITRPGRSNWVKISVKK
jgi:hypothetical protein